MQSRVTVVVPCVHLFVTMMATTYLLYTLKIRCHRVLYGVFKVFFVWLSLKPLCSKVLASFADHDRLSRFLMNSLWTEETVMASFQ